jgi:acyl-coenzyme A thioesterase PaaI-like protein
VTERGSSLTLNPPGNKVSSAATSRGRPIGVLLVSFLQELVVKNSSESIPRIEKYVDFSSPANEFGLGLELIKTEDGAAATFTLPNHMGGWQFPKYLEAHPGPVDGVLQTAMGFAAMYKFKSAARLKSFQVEYLQPVVIGEELTTTASVLARRGDDSIMEAIIKNDEGEILAKGMGTFELISSEQLASKAMCAPGTIKNFEEVLATL